MPWYQGHHFKNRAFLLVQVVQVGPSGRHPPQACPRPIPSSDYSMTARWINESRSAFYLPHSLPFQSRPGGAQRSGWLRAQLRTRTGRTSSHLTLLRLAYRISRKGQNVSSFQFQGPCFKKRTDSTPLHTTHPPTYPLKHLADHPFF